MTAEIKQVLIVLFEACARFGVTPATFAAYEQALEGVDIEDVKRAGTWFIRQGPGRCPTAPELRQKALELAPKSRTDEHDDARDLYKLTGEVPPQLAAIFDVLDKAPPGGCKQAIIDAGLCEQRDIDNMMNRLYNQAGGYGRPPEQQFTAELHPFELPPPRHDHALAAANDIAGEEEAA